MILVMDNYDSFTFNLVQMLRCLGGKVVVRRNDRRDWIAIMGPSVSGIVISPGPGRPEYAGASMDIIRCYDRSVPILGVCLGHQAVAAVYGARIERARRLLHGKTSLIYHDGRTIFRDVPNPFEANRYHSLIVAPDPLPGCLEVSAWTKEGEIMGLRHRKFAVEGIQFHPESVLTHFGARILENYVRTVRAGQPDPKARIAPAEKHSRKHSSTNNQGRIEL